MVARYLFYSLRNRFLTLQKIDFEKTIQQVCDIDRRVWEGMWVNRYRHRQKQFKVQ